MEPESPLQCSQEPPLIHILSSTHTVHTFPPYFPKIHSNNIFLSVLSSSELSSFWVSWPKFCTHFSSPPCMYEQYIKRISIKNMEFITSSVSSKWRGKDFSFTSFKREERKEFLYSLHFHLAEIRKINAHGHFGHSVFQSCRFDLVSTSSGCVFRITPMTDTMGFTEAHNL